MKWHSWLPRTRESLTNRNPTFSEFEGLIRDNKFFSKFPDKIRLLVMMIIIKLLTLYKTRLPMNMKTMYAVTHAISDGCPNNYHDNSSVKRNLIRAQASANKSRYASFLDRLKSRVCVSCEAPI